MTRRPKEQPDCERTGQQGSRRAQKSLEALRRRLLRHPLDPVALTQAGTLLYEVGNYREAVPHLQKALSSAETLLRQGKGRQALAGQSHLSVAAKALKRLGDCCAARGQPAQAVRYYFAAAAVAPMQVGPYLGLGLLGLQDGRIEEAEQLFRLAREVRADCGEALTGLGMVHQQRGEYSAAFDMYLRALQLDTDDLVALLGLFQVSCQMGSFSQIIHYLEVYLQKHPDDTSVLLCLATLYGREGRLDQTRQTIRKILEYEPGKPEAVRLLAELETVMAADGPASR